MKSRGGARKGAGRKKRLPQDIQNHVARERLSGRHPLHINFKLNVGLKCLRHKEVFRVFQEAVRKAQSLGFRVNHFAILHNHGHLIVEVGSNKDLERLMKVISIRLALRVKRMVRISRSVFRDRYFLHVLKTPTEVRNALRYVLLNEPRHIHGGVKNIVAPVFDSFNSGHSFQYWKQLWGRTMSQQAPAELLTEVSPAGTWLLRVGWMRA